MAIIFENDAELRSVKANSSIIPEYSLSIMEDALYVAEAIEMADKACSECIGINELNIYESTGELVYYNEADEAKASKWNIKSIKDTLIKWAKKLWEAIKSFFDKIVTRFASMRKSVEKAMTQLSAAQVMKLPGDASFGEVYNFAGLDGFDDKQYCENAKKFATKLTAKALSIKQADKEYRDYTPYKEAAKDVLKEVTGENVENIGTFKKNLIEKLCGEKVKADKKFVEDHLAKLKKALDLGEAKQSLKRQYSESRKLIDGYMSNIKGTDGNNIEAYVACKPALSQIVSCMNTANSAILKVYTMEHSQAVALLAKVVLACQKAEKAIEKAVGEAVEEVVDQQSLVESLFNF